MVYHNHQWLRAPGLSSSTDEPILVVKYLYLFTTFINYHSVEDVVAQYFHQGEDAEARGDVSHQGAGSLQGLCLLWLDFTQERLQEGVTSLNLVC